MICYRDRTYCTYYNCVNVPRCPHVLTREVREAAVEAELPVAVFAGKPECFIQDIDYQEGY